jgi:hypothetical protein
VPADGPVGLTPLARVLVDDGAEGVDLAITDDATHFTVQGDHTIVAPPDLDPSIRAQLERIAELESDAGALIFRVDSGVVTRALDAGADIDDLVAFLHQHSVVPVPSNVERTLRDAGARHGRIVVGRAQAYVTSDDPVLLAQAVAVKAAQLVQVNDTTAVSPLTEAKVLQALRSRSLAPVSARGPNFDDGGEEDAPRRYREPPAPLRDRLFVDATAVTALAKRLADTLGPRPRARSSTRDAPSLGPNHD